MKIPAFSSSLAMILAPTGLSDSLRTFKISVTLRSLSNSCMLYVLQVSLDLPLRDPDPVLVPLRVLDLQKILVDVLPQGLLEDLVLLEVPQGIGQGGREGVYAPRLLLLLRHVEDVLLHWRRGI